MVTNLNIKIKSLTQKSYSEFVENINFNKLTLVLCQYFRHKKMENDVTLSIDELKVLKDLLNSIDV